MKRAAFSLLLACLTSGALHAQWAAGSPLDNGPVNDMVSDGTYLYAATFDGVFRTTNPASGWELVASGDESRYYQNIYVIDGAIYTGAVGGAKAHRLENGSETWSLVIDDPDAFMNHFTKVGGTYFATDLSSNDLRSSTDGESWEFVELENFPLGGYIFGVGNRLFAHTSPSGELYKSDDLQSFSVLLDGYVGMVAVSGNTIFAQRQGSLAVSTDAGDTWTEFTNHPAFDFTGAALNDGVVYNGMWVLGSQFPFRGLLISSDQGASWEFVDAGSDLGMPLKDFTVHNGVLYGSSVFGTVSRIDFDGSTPSFTEEGNGLRSSGVLDFAVAGDKLFGHRFNGSRYTINGDLTTSPGFEEWTGVDLPANSGLQLNKNFRDGVFVVFTSPEDAIYMRRHNDNSFTNITGNLTELLGPNWFVFAALMADDVICMHMSSGNFVTSSDGGTTWVDRGVVPYSLRPEVLYHNGSIIAFSGLGPHAVYRSNDLGETWEEIGSVGWLNMRFAATNGNRILVMAADERAISDDGGVTWQVLDNNGLYFAVHQVSNTAGTVVANTYLTESQLMVSHDMGETFEALSTDGLPEHMPFAQTLINFGDSNDRLYLQYEGGLFFSAPKAALGIETTVGEVLQTERVLVYPNPASDRLSFEVLDERTHVRMVDLRGAVLFESVLPSGSNAVDLSEFSEGWYLLHLVGLQSNTVRSAPFLIRR